jgi:hypothetical protein
VNLLPLQWVTFIRIQDPLFLLAFTFPTCLSHLRRSRSSEIVHMRMDYNRDHSYLEAAATSSSLGLVASTDGRDEPSQPPLPGDSPNAIQPPGQPRKSRRDKMRIELSADQPPTTQGRHTERVYVACVQWYAPSHLATIIFLQHSLAGTQNPL